MNYFKSVSYKRADKISCYLRIWSDKTYFLRTIVRWPAVISNPALASDKRYAFHIPYLESCIPF